jgi:hypothetical protein
MVCEVAEMARLKFSVVVRPTSTETGCEVCVAKPDARTVIV